MKITPIGLDLAKHWVQVHGIDNEGRAILRRPLRRAEVLGFFAEFPPCLVGMEACATTHYWARQIARAGHQLKLILPTYVKAYVHRGKNDAVDAEAICEAVRCPNMRFVAVKSVDRHAFLMLHRSRELLVRQRSTSACAIRAHLTEFGIIAPQGCRRVDQLAGYLEGEEGKPVPLLARVTLRLLIDQLGDLSSRISKSAGDVWFCLN